MAKKAAANPSKNTSENAFVTIIIGLKQLKDNPVLFIPGIAYYSVSVFLAILFGVFAADFSNYFGARAFSIFYGLFLILIIFISSFTTAGSIGMAKEVIESRSANYKQFFSYGKKYTLKLVWAAVFISLIRLVSAIFWKPVLNIIGDSEYGADYVINALNNDPALLAPMFDALAAPVLAAVLLSSAYLILVSFMFYFVSYIIVVDDLGVFKSYQKSFKLLRMRPIRVLSFVFLVTVIQLLITFIGIFIITALSYIGFSFYFGFAVHLILAFFLTAAMNVWVTRFYMILSKKECFPID
ncbi:hypothetical protein MmiEs2_06110 [Methanimicrococcus stummii]|uniref:DUF7847 domain-containing protein n=1 Tax=Methanimicrococcus stummii TaxID=3028294 RepID=A0AA96VHP8_9EURY|nr:hypothetical protein [Methanimicrococcus sp. Es2]WNY28426.1 hypothetical protein MmiEs2_06110 [Methanimicrococcus sp. Es2]